MIYLDNAATSHFKPKSVLDALNSDILHSANSGRSGHDEATKKSVEIERARATILKKLGADENYSVIFTKNCTEALNLAIFGIVKGGEKIITSKNEHNSVLRPLFHLANINRIKLSVLAQKYDHSVDIENIKEAGRTADILVFGGACNVNGTLLNLEEVGKIAKKNQNVFVVDGAQCVPYCEINMKECGIDMLACPGHKGLHGIQGTGFLVVRNDLKLEPLLYGGTGTHSSEVLPGLEYPDSYEAGTQFSGGIYALNEGIKWTYSKLDLIKKHIDRLSKFLILNLKNIGATVYSNETKCGVVAFNLHDLDSTFVADILNENGIAVRAGLHCAPLVHEHLGTLQQGAVRISIGCDNTDKEITTSLGVLENILRNNV